MQGAGCRVQGAGCRVQGAGCRSQGAGCRVQGAGCRVQGAGCRVQGAGCRSQVRISLGSDRKATVLNVYEVSGSLRPLFSKESYKYMSIAVFCVTSNNSNAIFC